MLRNPHTSLSMQESWKMRGNKLVGLVFHEPWIADIKIPEKGASSAKVEGCYEMHSNKDRFPCFNPSFN